MIHAAIFDMDGVLIDSEPLWQDAEIAVFATVNVHLSREQCMETKGIRIDEVVQYRYEQQPWDNKSQKQVENEILGQLENLIRQKGEAMPGVASVLAFFRDRDVRLALASSSYLRVIKTVLEKLHMHDVFEVVHSGEFEKQGKPHPAIYLTTLQKLNLQPEEAIAIEDSYNGLLSAKRAGVKTVVIPEAVGGDDSKFDLADLKLQSLTEFGESHWQRLQSDKI